jgi:hypothetical protein
MQTLPDALAPLAAYRQFVAYVIVPSATRPGKNDKFPVDCRTGAVSDAHNPAIWTDVQTAIATAARLGPQYGVGFVFTENDPFFFIDIDNCLVPDNYVAPTSWNWSTLAQQLVAAFPGAAVEVSSSGKGLHIIGSGRAPTHRKKNREYNLEFYTEKRFIALTGDRAVGNAATDFTHLLPSLVEQFFKFDGTVDGGDFEWTTGPCDGWNGPTDDDALLERMLRSVSKEAAFGNKASFRDLFEGNIEVLARAYPDPERGYDASSADAALMQHLAFWTGKDCERMLRIAMRSALRRPKWDRPDYLRERTIPNAVRQQRDVLCDRVAEPLAHHVDTVATVAGDPEAPKATTVTGSTFLGIDEQIKLFSGCVYVTDIHRVLTPGGTMLKPDQFRVIYGGYTFMMDNANERTSRDAYEAFTQSQAFRRPTADGTCFKPDRAPGEIIRDAGRSRVNTWWPVDVPRQTGDVTPFMTHLEKLLPNARDRQILLAYMCACVQHKGFKFQWAPLLQGVEGNGKTLLTRCVAEAVGRRYVHWPKASKLAKEFNAWMLGKLFYGVEDIYVPDSKREVIEELKPMITGGDGLEIEGKGVDQISADVCGNFMFNSNHKDAIRKTRNDRRFAVFYTAQQHAADLVRDGMTGDYFPNLYAWLRNGGYAIVSELLHTLPIPDEYNPATSCQRAPDTTSTDEAITSSMGGVEQEIIEAIEQGLPGFAAGWVSSMALDKLLERLNRARSMPQNKRKELLDSLGYIAHPGLKDGRVNNVILPDNGKPKLFIRKDHPDRFVTGAAEIARAYSNAQGPTVFSNA